MEVAYAWDADQGSGTAEQRVEAGVGFDLGTGAGDWADHCQRVRFAAGLCEGIAGGAARGQPAGCARGEVTAGGRNPEAGSHDELTDS